MTEVELMCAVYGLATVFLVKIARDAKVCALQNAIVNKKKDDNARFKVDPNDFRFKLYLARKNGKWLTGGQDVYDLLLGQVDTAYTQMLPWWSLDKLELFGPTFEPGKDEIHVLVELPEAPVDVLSELATSNQMLKEAHEEPVQSPKRKRYVHSEMTSNKGKEFLQDLGMRIDLVDTDSPAIGNLTPVEPFKWGAAKSGGKVIKLYEEQQRDQYRAYVEENIGAVLKDQRLCVFVPGYDVNLFGRTDLVIMNDKVKSLSDAVDWFPDARMLIEVQRSIQNGAVYQVASELVAFDVLAQKPVMALLTNLTDRWQFQWISEKSHNHINIQTVVLSNPSEAFEVVRTLLTQVSSVDGDIHLPFIREPVKRRKLEQLFPSVSEGGDSGGILETLQQYRDITSLLGQPDIDMARWDALFGVHAGISIVIGAACLLRPRFLAISALKTSEYNHLVHEMVRLYGALTLAQGWLVWKTRLVGDGLIRKTFCQAYCLCFSLQAIVMLRAQISSPESRSVLNWINILVLAGLGSAYGYFLFFKTIKAFELSTDIYSSLVKSTVSYAGGWCTRDVT
ncbi:hypothetical protein AC1031_020202 [Aphanomyces cochlioides]|nr:hypothetical protein AC1031_020202 [Aphanomyces cochlioides]